MFINSRLQSLERLVNRGNRRRYNRQHGAPRFLMARLEMLEHRTLLSAYNVLNLGDSGPGSLRQAMVDANAHPGADVINFASKVKGTIALTSELSITDDLKIDGPGACRLKVSGGGITRVFNISGSATDVRIDDLTIANGLASETTLVGPTTFLDGFPIVQGGSETLGGGILNNGGALTLDDVSMLNNRADAGAGGGVNAGGGGIANIFGATLTVRNCTFRSNQVQAGSGDCYGGAILNDADSSLGVTNSTFTANQATQGLWQGSFGGAIASQGGSTASISGSLFQDNLARGAAGNFSFYAEPPYAFGAGGGISSQSWSILKDTVGPASLTVSYSNFVGNQAIGGQGVDAGATGVAGGGGQSGGSAIGTFGSGSSINISCSTFTGNLARSGDGGDGGAAKPDGGTAGDVYGTVNVCSANLSVANCVFTANRSIGGAGGNAAADGNGGDGGFASSGIVTGAWGYTVDIWDAPANVVIRNSVFTGNQAIAGKGGDGGSDGGAGGAGGWGVGGSVAVGGQEADPYTLVGGSLIVSGSTFTGNQAIGADGGAGGVGGVGGPGGVAIAGAIDAECLAMTVRNSIFAANRAIAGNDGAGAYSGESLYGAARLAYGGAIMCGFPFDPSSNQAIISSLFVGNWAQGGAAAPGGDGGTVYGGAICNGAGTLTVSGSTLIGNSAVGGAGGVGANGGDALGGGFYSMGTSTLIQTIITRNKARGGAAGPGGEAGIGIGGGVYNDLDFGASIPIDALTKIFGNSADLLPDLFGC
jgi:hypothetical protein